VVPYSGSAPDRLVIRDTEFFFEHDDGFPDGPGGAVGGGPRPSARSPGPGRKCGFKFHVLLTSYETLRADKEYLRKVPFVGGRGAVVGR